MQKWRRFQAQYHLDDQVEGDTLLNGPDVDPVVANDVADHVKNSREFFGVQEKTVATIRFC